MFEISELLKIADKTKKADIRNLYKWSARADRMHKALDSVRVADDLNLFTGMTKQELKADLQTKQGVLQWLVANGVDNVDDVGKVISNYYTDPDDFFKTLKRRNAKEILLKHTSGEDEE